MRQIKGQISITEYLGTLEAAVCNHSGHTCNKSELWRVADTLDMGACPHVCCRSCNVRLCGARCNGSEEPIKEPGKGAIHRYLRYGAHTLIPEVRDYTKQWLDEHGVPDWVTWPRDSLPCKNCTWYDGKKCCDNGHTNHYEYKYLICDGFYQSIVERKPSTVGESAPSRLNHEPIVYDIDIRGLCDDPYCPQCGRGFWTEKNHSEVDCERCPDCQIRLDWTRWHKINDEP